MKFGKRLLRAAEEYGSNSEFARSLLDYQTLKKLLKRNIDNGVIANAEAVAEEFVKVEYTKILLILAIGHPSHSLLSVFCDAHTTLLGH